ncbi:hypothetical protein CHS0354_007156 [Potamilus streckersoni]|uniref:OTU domain-containing protein n=1 Tax=Potamilus streckersoni TaxID=2493646 RepID=A0AAE0SFC6_9BIVA|nr:hypothetical protein CHS0354_007156 [Potamilus streckersoni]
MIFDTSPFFFESWTHPQNWHSYYHQHYLPLRRVHRPHSWFSSNWEPTRDDWGHTSNDSERTQHYRFGAPRTIPIKVERADLHATKVYYELSDDDDDSIIEILTPQEVELDFNNSASTNNRKRRKSVTQQPVKLLEKENASRSTDEVICKDVELQHANYAEGSRRRNLDNNDKVFSISFVQDRSKQSVSDRESEKSDDVDICDELSSSSTDLKYKLEENEKEINGTPGYTIYSYLSELLMQSGRQIDYIRGDGNCFFRALSKVVYGTESCHKQIREAVVDVIKKYPKKFEAYLDLDDGGIRNHTQEMRQLGTWATQTEIYAAATLLQRDIYVLSPDPSGDNYKWLFFTPVFQYSGDISYHPCFITLCHTNGNHYDRVATIEGKCNCNIDPPELSGINTSVDLASEIV